MGKRILLKYILNEIGYEIEFAGSREHDDKPLGSLSREFLF
jgi:hypothetical protein